MSLNPYSPSHRAFRTSDRPAPYRLPTLASTDPAALPLSELSSSADPHGKQRRASRVRTGRQTSPSAASPAMSESELEKKRNKLGYQRISIACAHCRRRKIRCLVAEGDAQSRCQNCIRLKKECVFYPVDQQGVVDSSSQAPSQTTAGSGAASAVSSSPNNSASERHFEVTGEYNGYHVVSGAQASFQSLDMTTGIPGVFPNQGEFSDSGMAYTSQGESRPPWLTPGAYTGTPGTMGMPPPGHAPFWRGPSHSAAGGDYAPFVGSSPQQPYPQNAYGSSMDYMQRGGQAWPLPPPPTRSMSYGVVESLPVKGPHGFGAVGAHAPQRRPSPMRYAPSPLDVHSGSVSHLESGSRSAPIGVHPNQFGSSPYMYQHSPAQHPHSADPWYNGFTPYGNVEHTASPHGPHGQFQSMPRHPT